QVAQLEKSNAKKTIKKLVKVRQLARTISQYRLKHNQYISITRAATHKPS
ncbi:3989_t:CDS:1, partial [Rhizophagus irregularis]